MRLIGVVARRRSRRASGTLTLTRPGSLPGGWSSAVAGACRCRARLGAGRRGWRRAGQRPAGGAGRAAATASRAWAHMDSTVCRWKECQVRTWCWSRPVCPFPCWWHSSIGHLFPATLIRTARVTGRPFRDVGVEERQVSGVGQAAADQHPVPRGGGRRPRPVRSRGGPCSRARTSGSPTPRPGSAGPPRPRSPSARTGA